MFSFNYIFLALLSVTSIVNAAPTPESSVEIQKRAMDPYQITKMRFAITANNNLSGQFSVVDPVPASNAPHTCRFTGTLAASAADFHPCLDASGKTDPSFVWKMENSATVGSIQLRHSYKDESVGPCSRNPDGTPVYCGVITWARANISSTDFTCQGGSKTSPQTGTIRCTQKSKVIEAGIFQAVA